MRTVNGPKSLGREGFLNCQKFALYLYIVDNAGIKNSRWTLGVRTVFPLPLGKGDQTKNGTDYRAITMGIYRHGCQ